ncbi:EthD domain-containing protein [Aspergillus venezuelensis]
MPFKALLYVTRKPGTTPAEFKTHYETVHVPLIKKLAGDLFPLSHRRLYLARPGPGDDCSYPVAVVLGDQGDFTYDCITELTFPDEKAMQIFFAKRMEPGTKEVVEEDENKFLQADKLKLVVLGDVQETAA